MIPAQSQGRHVPIAFRPPKGIASFKANFLPPFKKPVVSLGKVDIDTFLPPGVSQLDLDAAELLDFSTGSPDPQIVQALIRNGALQDLPEETLQMLGGGAITKKQLRQLATVRALIDNGTITPEAAQKLVAAAMARDAAKNSGQGSPSGSASSGGYGQKKPISTTTKKPVSAPAESVRNGSLTQKQMEQIAAIMSGATPSPPVVAAASVTSVPIAPAQVGSVTPNQIAALMANPGAVAALQNNPGALAALMANPAAMAALTNQPSSVVVPVAPAAPAPVLGGISPAMMSLILTNPAMMAAFQANPAAFATVQAAPPGVNQFRAVPLSQAALSPAQLAALQTAGISPTQFAAFQAAGGTAGSSAQLQTAQAQLPQYGVGSPRLVPGQLPTVPNQIPGVSQGQVPVVIPGQISSVPSQIPGQVQVPMSPGPITPIPTAPTQAPVVPVPPTQAPIPVPPPQPPVTTPTPVVTTTINIPGFPPGVSLPPGLPASVAAQLPPDFNPADFEGLPPEIIKQAFPELVAQLTDEEIRLLTSQANAALGIRRKKNLSQAELNFIKSKMEAFIKKRDAYERWLLSHIPAKDRPIGSSIKPKKINIPTQAPVGKEVLRQSHYLLEKPTEYHRKPAPPPGSATLPPTKSKRLQEVKSTHKPKATTTDFLRLSKKPPRQANNFKSAGNHKPVLEVRTEKPQARSSVVTTRDFTPSIKISGKSDSFDMMTSGPRLKVVYKKDDDTITSRMNASTKEETDSKRKNASKIDIPTTDLSSKEWGRKTGLKRLEARPKLNLKKQMSPIMTAISALDLDPTTSTTKRPRDINYYLSQQSKQPMESTTVRNFEKITTPIQPLKPSTWSWPTSTTTNRLNSSSSATSSARPNIKFRKIVSNPEEALEFFKGDIFGPFSDDETIVSEESLKFYKGDIIDLGEVGIAHRIRIPSSTTTVRSVRSNPPGSEVYEEGVSEDTNSHATTARNEKSVSAIVGNRSTEPEAVKTLDSSFSPSEEEEIKTIEKPSSNKRTDNGFQNSSSAGGADETSSTGNSHSLSTSDTILKTSGGAIKGPEAVVLQRPQGGGFKTRRRRRRRRKKGGAGRRKRKRKKTGDGRGAAGQIRFYPKDDTLQSISVKTEEKMSNGTMTNDQGTENTEKKREEE